MTAKIPPLDPPNLDKEKSQTEEKQYVDAEAVEAAKKEANSMMAEFIKQEIDKRAEFSSPSSINKKEAEVNDQATESADKTL